MSKIAVLEDLAISDSVREELERPFLKEGHEFSHYKKSTDIPTLLQEVQDADALILANMPLKREVIEGAKNLRYIDIAFTGVDHVALDACKERNIHVSNASGYSNEAVSELVLADTLSLYRHLSAVEARCRSYKDKTGYLGKEIKGHTVGIIGYGNIGKRTAELFHAFGAKVLANKRTPCPVPEYVTLTDMDTVLKESDIVVLHCPLNDSTRHMINMDKIRLMKKDAILINVARGPVVVAQDLAQALRDGVIAGAAVDVFDKEPPLEESEPLLSCPNCLVTPHVAFATEESMILRAEIVYANLAAWLDGKIENQIL